MLRFPCSIGSEIRDTGYNVDLRFLYPTLIYCTEYALTI